MRVFRYQAVDARGKNLNGRMSASDESALEQKVKTAGLWLTEAAIDRTESARAAPKAAGGGPRMSNKKGRRELIDFCTLMTFQLRVGVPLVRALDVAGQDC